METHLQIIGYLLIGLALMHIPFPQYFKWKQELNAMALINRQMMQVHTFFIAIIVLLMGILCVSSYALLIQTPLGQRLCLGLGFFWTLRLLIQFFWYDPALWKGKKFETTVHIVFSLLWVYLSSVFLYIAWH